MAQEQTAAPKKSFNFENFMIGVGIFLLEILVPVVVTGGLLFWLSTTINYWAMDRNLAISIFAILFVLITLILTIFMSDFISRLRNKKSPRLRLAIFIIGGLIVPIGVFTAANLLTIRPGESYLTRLISLSLNQTVDVSMTQLGTTIESSTNPYTKAQGINAIQTIHTAAGLEQLFSILKDDPLAVSNVQVSGALSQAIASYGVQAKPGLIAAFQAHLNTTQLAKNLPTDLYSRYFAQSIADLKAEISAQSLDSPTRQGELQQIDGLAIQMKSGLDALQAQSLKAAGGDPVLDFVFNSFQEMNLSQDGDIYSLARTTASNTNTPDSVRGKALLLLAKMGTKEDMTLLYSYLQNSSETIKAYAFTAIANLTLKLNGPAKTQ